MSRGNHLPNLAPWDIGRSRVGYAEHQGCDGTIIGAIEVPQELRYLLVGLPPDKQPLGKGLVCATCSQKVGRSATKWIKRNLLPELQQVVDFGLRHIFRYPEKKKGTQVVAPADLAEAIYGRAAANLVLNESFELLDGERSTLGHRSVELIREPCEVPEPPQVKPELKWSFQGKVALDAALKMRREAEALPKHPSYWPEKRKR